MKRESLVIRFDGRDLSGGISIGQSIDHLEHEIHYSGYMARKFLNDPNPDECLKLIPSLNGNLQLITLDLHDVGFELPEEALEKAKSLFQKYTTSRNIAFIFLPPLVHYAHPRP